MFLLLNNPGLEELVVAVFNIKQGNDYIESYYNKDTGFEVGYYTAKEMKASYPNGGIRVAGQFKYGKHESGTMTVDGIDEVVYRADTSVRYKTIGYVELENGAFVAVKKDRIAALILLILLGLLAVLGLIFGIKYAIDTGVFNTPEEPTNGPMTIDPGALEGSGIWDELPTANDMTQKNVTIRGITQIKFKAGQTRQNQILTNDAKNKDVCFMQFVIYLDNNGDKKIDSGDEKLYESGLVQPGYSISHFDITRPLSAGTYKVIVLQQPYSWEQQTTKLNNMVNAVDLIVE